MNKIVLLLLSFFCFTQFSINAQNGYKIGDKAYDFSLKNIDGKQVSLDNFKNVKGFIIIFTCNHCPFSIAYEDRIIALDKKYNALGYQLIAINPNDPAVSPDDSYEKMIVRAKEKKFTFPYLFDDGQKVYPLFGATRTPHVFILDQSRTVRYIGAIDDNVNEPENVKLTYLENALNEIISGKNVTLPTTKALGCSIKKQS